MRIDDIDDDNGRREALKALTFPVATDDGETPNRDDATTQSLIDSDDGEPDTSAKIDPGSREF